MEAPSIIYEVSDCLDGPSERSAPLGGVASKYGRSSVPVLINPYATRATLAAMAHRASNSRAQWFTRLLHCFSCPAAITRHSPDTFAQEAWTIVGRKVNKRGFLHDLYLTASQSIGLPVAEESEAIQMFRVILAEHQQLCACRAAFEQQADHVLSGQPDYHRLRTLPGVGPILALTILAQAGEPASLPPTIGNSSSSVGLI